MDINTIKSVLESVEKGDTSVSSALNRLKHLPFEDLSFARVDHHRVLRQGLPEIVYAANKSREETLEIARAILQKSGRTLITRVAESDISFLKDNLEARLHHNRHARTITAYKDKKKSARKGNVLILTAGTSDIPVAEEARVTAEFLGSRTSTAFDVGVAGLHRLMDRRRLMDIARAIIVVAGMEGALPSVVGGMTDRPVIAVPTSVGYGTSFGGIAALLAMLNSCVPGIAVMNIDNGFGAACLAHRINDRCR